MEMSIYIIGMNPEFILITVAILMFSRSMCIKFTLEGLEMINNHLYLSSIMKGHSIS